MCTEQGEEPCSGAKHRPVTGITPALRARLQHCSSSVPASHDGSRPHLRQSPREEGKPKGSPAPGIHELTALAKPAPP